MHQRPLAILIFLLFPIAALSAVSVIQLPKTPQQLRDEIPSIEPIDSVTAATTRDAEVIDLDAKHKAGQRMMLVGGAESFVVSLEQGDVVAYLVEIQSAKQNRNLRIDGYMIDPGSTMPYVMFPLATALDSDGSVLQTLTPLENSRAKNNALQNYFLLPEGTKYLLVHGHPDIMASSTAEAENDDGGAKALAALGGIFGGVLYGASQNRKVERGEANLSSVGVVEIFAE